MAEALRLVCGPACNYHTAASADIVRSLLHFDHCGGSGHAPATLAPDGMLPLHIACAVGMHTAHTVEIVKMLVSAFRDGVFVRKGRSSRARLPLHFAVCRSNCNEVRSCGVPMTLWLQSSICLLLWWQFTLQIAQVLVGIDARLAAVPDPDSGFHAPADLLRAVGSSVDSDAVAAVRQVPVASGICYQCVDGIVCTLVIIVSNLGPCRL